MTETYHGFIDTAHDALLIFEACNSGFLPRVQRRFSDRERQTIRSGAVYVWDEEETGMRRWTDGRTWSPSRVHGCFLIYYELEGRRHQFVNKSQAGQSRSSRNSPRSGQTESMHSYDPSPPNIMQKEQGLIKKALSLCTNDKRKLHLVCYYSREDVESGCLMSPTNDPRFAGVQIFEERYPEIGHGSGRSDRYGGGRIKTSVGTNRQWNPTSPDSPGAARDGPPAYVRTSMTIEKRSRSYRNEVFRYPSYGPYVGPVRHINASGPQTSQISQSYQSPMGIDMPNGADNGSRRASPSALFPSPSMSRDFLTPATGGSSARPVHQGKHQQQSFQDQQHQQMPYLANSYHQNAVTPITFDEHASAHELGGHHQPFHKPNGAGIGGSAEEDNSGSTHPTMAHSYPAASWKTASLSSGSAFSGQTHPYQHSAHNVHAHGHYSQGGSHMPGYPSSAAPAAHFSTPSNSLPTNSVAGTQPVWQHTEAPRTYTEADGNARNYAAVATAAASAVAAPPGISVWEGTSGATTASQIPNANGSAPFHQNQNQNHNQNQNQNQHFTQQQLPSLASPMVRLPSIERLDSSNGAEGQATHDRWKKQSPSFSSTTATGDNSTSRMTSEDMRQLASLRLSLH
ncbi:Gluconate transport-inducing protein [Coemansia sp. RSA 1286]|nr:Gluconate transport-inducing protein [Coemansia sp. RSA 1286]